MTSDFGTTGSYVGAMRGAALSADPDARLVDITHNIPPQDVGYAARVLYEAAPIYPPGTVHLVVVDPGVGTDRAAIVVHAGGHLFVGPDNGVLVPAARSLGAVSAWSITDAALMRHPVSATFHGRDVFAPVAGALSSRRVAPHAVGDPIDPERPPNPPAPDRDGDTILGQVIYVDHFGNLITNIPASWLDDFPAVLAGGFTMPHVRTYGDHEADLVSLVGSSGWLEIASPGGSAASKTGLCAGSKVVVQ